MKIIRTVAIALALTAVAAVAAIPSIDAADSISKGVSLRAATPQPNCPPHDPQGCGIYSK